MYRQRNQVERFFNRIKQMRGLATRYDRRADNYLAALKLAATRIWIASLRSPRPRVSFRPQPEPTPGRLRCASQETGSPTLLRLDQAQPPPLKRPVGDSEVRQGIPLCLFHHDSRQKDCTPFIQFPDGLSRPNETLLQQLAIELYASSTTAWMGPLTESRTGASW